MTQNPDPDKPQYDLGRAIAKMIITPELEASMQRISRMVVEAAAERLHAQLAPSINLLNDYAVRQLTPSFTALTEVSQRLAAQTITPQTRATILKLIEQVESQQTRDDVKTYADDDIALPVGAENDIGLEDLGWASMMFFVLYAWIKDVVEQSAQEVAETTIATTVLVLLLLLARDRRKNGA
jgi:hypothetical protein